MQSAIPDLWPQSFGEPTRPAPVAILRQQGILLGQKTDNLVYGEVQSRAHPSGFFAHVLEVVAPLLGFRQPVAVAHHRVEEYPAELGRPDFTQPINHFGIPVIDSPRSARSADEFIDVLRAILQSPETAKLIQTLLVQSASPAPPTTTAGPRY